MKRKIQKYYLIIFDIIAIALSLTFAFVFKYNLNVPENIMGFALKTFITVCIIKVIVYKMFSLYSSLWEFASIEELMQVVMAVAVSSVLTFAFLFTQGNVISLAVLINAMVLEILFIGGIRFSYRILRRMKNNRSLVKQKIAKNVLIVGAGTTGGMIAKELNFGKQKFGHFVGFIDDDLSKIGKSVNAKRVHGNRAEIVAVCKRLKVDTIIVAIPSATQRELKGILAECAKTDCELKTVPSLSEIIDGKVSMKQVRDVEIEDLLGREAVDLDVSEIQHYIENRTIMVTGGGGSIGSELCRQIAKFNPKKLIILDIYENNAYDIQNELRMKYEGLNLVALIASVRDKDNIDEIFKTYQPEVVFHAAAHKHVPLMETAPREAILNNCFGTLNVADAAHRNKTSQFVLISTDKAVNPTNVMGTSKRICEMIIQSYSKKSETKFSGVRFGNVLGSNGSVIPLFKRQIKEGGPITVTHKDIIRYFMTIPEAAQLVLQSGAYAKGGEIFVLDMGEPVKIYELAKNLIKLSGFEPHEDIGIEVTGLRPGEKLYEELLMAEEGMKETPHSKIFIGRPTFTDFKVLMNMLDQLKNVLLEKDNALLREHLMMMVPSYKPNNEINKKFVDNGCTNDFEVTYKVN